MAREAKSDILFTFDGAQGSLAKWNVRECSAKNQSDDAPCELRRCGVCRRTERGHYDFVVAAVSRIFIESEIGEELDVGILLLVLFQELLRRYKREESVPVNYSLCPGRVGRLNLSGDRSVRDAVKLLQAEAATAGRNEGEAGARFIFCEEDLQVEENSLPPYAISLTLQLNDAGLHGHLDYDPKSYPWFTIQSLGDHFGHTLISALEELDRPLSEIQVVCAADLAELGSWNNTDRKYPNLRADQLFDIRAEALPDDEAAAFQGKSYTYHDLALRASGLAAKLRRCGVVPGEVVAVYLQRCLDVPAAILGVLKAGGGFLALDPSLPPERVKFMLEDGRAKVILTQTALLDQLPATEAEILCLDCFDPAGEGGLAVVPSLEADAEDVAYILYTSGSTGKPKGVEITHRGLTNLLMEMIHQLDLGKDDVVLATAALSFDISSFEVLAPLIAGARVVVVSRLETTDGEALSRIIDEEEATLVQATPSGWRILLETGWRGRQGLKLMTCAEPLDRQLARKLLDRGAAVWNLYGPTETTVYSTMRRLSYEDATITVGKALSNYTTYILDQNGRRLPVGATGELFIGGHGVARGYRNLPELTAQRFVPDPFSGLPKARMYGSGDLARYLPDGQIEVLGRIDNQIKIRGYRIELEEIERVLDECETVSRAIVNVVDFGNSDRRLVAFIVPAKTGAPIDDQQLRRRVAAALPIYMVPTIFRAVDEVPLTTSGKVNRKALALAKPVEDPEPPARRAKDGSGTHSEGTVLAIWRRVLQVPDLGLDDDFFDCGGHSLLAARMFGQLSDLFGQKLPVTLLLEARTVRQLTHRISSGGKSAMLVSLQKAGALPPLYLVHHLLGDAMVYRHLANCFGNERPVVGIQACQEVSMNPAFRSIEKLASVYVSEILARQSSGPFHIAGYSSGGPIAYEMARQLTDRGYQVGLLGLVDASIDHRQAPVSGLESFRKLVLQKACRVAFKFRYELSKSPVEIVCKRVKSLRLTAKVRRLRRPGDQACAADLNLEEALLVAEQSYQPRPYSGSGLLIRYQDEAKRFGPNPLMGWDGMFGEGKLEVVDLPGNHVSGLFPPRIGMLAQLLKANMEQIERAKPPFGMPLSRTA